MADLVAEAKVRNHLRLTSRVIFVACYCVDSDGELVLVCIDRLT